MAKDLTVSLEDRPGALAALGEAMGGAGINIEGMSGDASQVDLLHILVEDAQGARQALAEAGIEIRDDRDVLVVEVEDLPGTLGAVTRKLADAGVNVDLCYATFGGSRLVLGVDDMGKATAAL
jgi:hypothetical protein